MEHEFTGQVALITGAGSGIGKKTATLLAARGATVMANDISADDADATAQAIRALGGEAHPITGDVTEPGFVDSMFDQVADDFGHLDIVHNKSRSRPPDPGSRGRGRRIRYPSQRNRSRRRAHTGIRGVPRCRSVPQYIAQLPLRRMAEAEDVAEAVAFLASPRAAAITGVSLPIDGGIGAAMYQPSMN